MKRTIISQFIILCTALLLSACTEAPEQGETTPEPEAIAPEQGDMTPAPEAIAPEQNEMTPAPEAVAPEQGETTPQPEEAALEQDEMSRSRELIVGEWKGTDHTGTTGGFIFSRDGSAKMIEDGVVQDGSTVGGKITWRIDAGHDPMHLDLVLTDASGDAMTLPMIVKFLSATEIQLRMSDDMTRPTEFSDSDHINQIILNRQ